MLLHMFFLTYAKIKIDLDEDSPLEEAEKNCKKNTPINELKNNWNKVF